MFIHNHKTSYSLIRMFKNQVPAKKMTIAYYIFGISNPRLTKTSISIKTN